MAIKPVKTEGLTLLQETYQKFWTRFNLISSSNEGFNSNFNVHQIASIRYYQDYAIGKPYHICIRISFEKELASIQAYFNNVVVYDEVYSQCKDRIEAMVGKRLIWKSMKTKSYAQLDLPLTYNISDDANWDAACKDMITYAIIMKETFAKF